METWWRSNSYSSLPGSHFPERTTRPLRLRVLKGFERYLKCWGDRISLCRVCAIVTIAVGVLIYHFRIRPSSRSSLEGAIAEITEDGVGATGGDRRRVPRCSR